MDSEIDFEFERAVSLQEDDRKRLLESHGVFGQRQAGPNGPGGAGTAANSHSHTGRTRSVLCRHWFRGMCWKGELCEYLHHYDISKMPVCTQYKKTGFCNDYLQGSCLFLHSETSTSSNSSCSNTNSNSNSSNSNSNSSSSISNNASITAAEAAAVSEAALYASSSPSSPAAATAAAEDDEGSTEQSTEGWPLSAALRAAGPLAATVTDSNNRNGSSAAASSSLVRDVNINRDNNNNNSSSFNSNNANANSPICIHYYLGFCREGPRCRSRHEKLDSSCLPPLVPDWYLRLILKNSAEVIPSSLDPESEIVMGEVEQVCRELAGSGLGTAAGAGRYMEPAAARPISASSYVSLSSSSSESLSASALSSSSLASPESPVSPSLSSSATGTATGTGTETGTATETDGSFSISYSKMTVPSINTKHANRNTEDRNNFRSAFSSTCNNSYRSPSPHHSSLSTAWVAATGPVEVAGAVDVSGPVQPRHHHQQVQLFQQHATTFPSSSIRTFIIKSIDIKNIQKSVRFGVWATSKRNTKLLTDAFSSNDHVMLIFSANESGGFQGYARMASCPEPCLFPYLWGSFSERLGFNFRVEWLKQCRVDFDKFGWLTNPMNDHQPIKKSRDCQEIPLNVAQIICTALNNSLDVDLLCETDNNESDDDYNDNSSTVPAVAAASSIDFVSTVPPSDDGYNSGTPSDGNPITKKARVLTTTTNHHHHHHKNTAFLRRSSSTAAAAGHVSTTGPAAVAIDSIRTVSTNLRSKPY